MNFSELLGRDSVWEGAKCLNRPDEFCPREDIMMTPEWTKSTAPQVAKECLDCPVFTQCKTSLLEQLEDEDISPTGVMAGVVLVQKSQSQIKNALARVEKERDKLQEERVQNMVD